jgi:hypothetical protein
MWLVLVTIVTLVISNNSTWVQHRTHVQHIVCWPYSRSGYTKGMAHMEISWIWKLSWERVLHNQIPKGEGLIKFVVTSTQSKPMVWHCGVSRISKCSDSNHDSITFNLIVVTFNFRIEFTYIVLGLMV